MPATNSKDRLGHYLFWGGGILLAVLPYLALFSDSIWRAPWILPPGRFADNLAIAARHLLIGATLGGWLWFLINRVNPLTIIRAWWQAPNPLNWIWFVLTLVIYSVHNILVLMNLPLGTGEFLSASAGRILTGFIVISFIWLAARIASLAGPRRLRMIPWAIPAFIPGFLGADAFAIIFWKNSLRHVLNKVDEDGPLDIARQLTAGGIHQSPAMVVFAILAFGGILCGCCFLSNRISRKASSGVGFPPILILFTLVLTWAGIAAEKAGGFAWKSRKALRMEQNSYDIHLTPIKPRPGLVSYAATWKPAVRPDVSAHATVQPDIFLIIMESTRADAISEKHAPFLTRFRDEECQQLGRTWAASNGTHLSWFSIFNGQIPPHWGPSMEEVRNGHDLPPSPMIQALANSGYKLQGRTVCDVSYLGMGATNFGSPNGLEFFKSAPSGGEFEKLPLSERERLNVDEAEQALLISPSSGNFHLLAFDSPHFDYVWHPDFTPPYSDYEPSGGFHAYPTDGDIERVRRRYFNAIAWTDHEIARFVNFLKEQHRYDDALIIITGDHGEEFQENGSWFHCSSVEPEQTAVPIMIKWPQGTQAPAQASASHLDLLPSLLDFLGQPSEVFEHLPGHSLLHPHEDEATQVNITSYCGIMGIAMAWHRGEYTATFRWENPWATQLPDTISLDDIIGPEGSLDLTTPEEWDAALRDHFPDAPARFFSNFVMK